MFKPPHPALLIVSLLTTPYSWMMDEVVLLPAILRSVLWINRAQLKVRSQLLILLFVFLGPVVVDDPRAGSPATGIYFWSSLVWFSWYWYASGLRGELFICSNETTAAAGSTR
jgi:hypothetical protein